MLKLLLTAMTALSLVLGLGWGAVPGAALAGAEEPVFGVEDLLEKALRDNPSLRISDYDIEVAKASLTQSQADYLPQLTVISSQSLVGSVSPQAVAPTPSTTDQGQFENKVTATQLIFDFGKTTSQIRQAEFGVSSSEEDRWQTIADLVRDLKVAYYDLLRQRLLWDIQKEESGLYQQYLDQAQALFEAGVNDKIFVTKAQLELSQSQLSEIKAHYTVENAKVTLENVLGGPPASGAYSLRPVGQLPQPPQDRAELEERALRFRPALLSLERQIAASTAGVEAAEGNLWPNFTAQGFHDGLGSQLPLSQTWQAGVFLTWNFFTGLRDLGGLSKAKAQLLKLVAQKRSKDLSVRAEVAEAYYNCLQDHEGIAMSQRSLAAAEENLEAAQIRFRAGLGTAVEYSDAVEKFSKAKADVADNIHTYLQDLAKLDRAVGELTLVRAVLQAKQVSQVSQTPQTSQVSQVSTGQGD
jgi:outer membrane protein